MATRSSPNRRPRRSQIVGVISTPVDLHLALRLSTPPDLFELRLDQLVEHLPELERAIARLPRPLIITARHPGEGGANQLSLKQRRQLLLRFLPRAQYVDVELRCARALRSLLAQTRRKNVGRIISFHDFSSTPTGRSLKAKARAAKTFGADIFKVATRTDTLPQLVRLLNFMLSETDQPGAATGIAVSAMGIGKGGALSRLLLAQCGSVLNYGSIGSQSQIEGQLSIDQLRSALPR